MDWSSTQPGLDRVTFAILVACFATFGLFWAVAAFWTKRTVERGRWSWRMTGIGLALVAFGLNRMGGGFRAFTSNVLWPRGPVSDVISIVLTVWGLVVMLWARVTLGSNWSGAVVFKQGHELVTTGPYAFVRHPIYSGLLLMLLGGAVYFGLVGGLLWLAVGFVVFIVKSRAEEELMTRHFPEAYPKYRTRVKALVPFVF